MTEAEWLASTDVVPLLRWLTKTVSQRKMQLYICGGCHQIKHLFFSPKSSTAVEVAERRADGFADAEEVAKAAYHAESPTFGYDFNEGFWQKPYIRQINFFEGRSDTLLRLVDLGALSASILSGGAWEVNETARERLLAAARIAEVCICWSPRIEQCLYDEIPEVDWPGRWLVDCIFGNPFRLPSVDSRWLKWHDGTVAKIAAGIYEERRFGDLPILADALEDAGCSDEQILTHCRGPGPHARGCWCVDLLLGKS